MKRIVFLLAIISGFTHIQAQGFNIGVYTEPQVAWLTSDEGSVIPSGSVINLNTGLEFDFFFMRNYAFTVALNLNNQGGKMHYTDSVQFTQTNTTLEVPPNNILKHNFQYVGVPIGLKLKTEEMGYTTFYIHGGLNPLFNTRATTSSEDLGFVRENIKPETNSFSMNYFAEIGVEYRLAGNTAVVGGIKWSAGFNDVTKNDFANNNLNSIALHLGILF